MINEVVKTIETEFIRIQGDYSKKEIASLLGDSLNSHPNTKRGKVISVAPLSENIYLVTWDLPSNCRYL